uniref:B2L14 protein n=1 Tax=Calidris pygmaea TaxID=425635 RepID=A0A8C3K210_9CHAR
RLLQPCCPHRAPLPHFYQHIFMCSPSDASMEEIPLEDDEQDSIEYKILMAYAQRRLSVSKYRKLLKNEANVQKSSLIGRKVETDHQRDKEGPTLKAAFQDGKAEIFTLLFSLTDEEKIIQTIVSLLRQKGDRLEEKIKKDKVFNQHFKDMLSYTFFKRITELFLEDVSAVSTSEPGDQVQCTKVAFTMEVATRLTAVDNHPMNLVLGFGLKYLREHFKPWIQDRGGWVCVLLHEELIHKS